MVKAKTRHKGSSRHTRLGSNATLKTDVKKAKVKQNKVHHSGGSASSIESPEQYKKGLLEVDKTEEKFDRLFEQKLASQYREFRNMKEHHMLTKKFVRIFIVLMTIILIALLLVSFS